MAALQDAYHEERAAALQRFAAEDAEIQARKAAEGRAESEQKVWRDWLHPSPFRS